MLMWIKVEGRKQNIYLSEQGRCYRVYCCFYKKRVYIDFDFPTNSTLAVVNESSVSLWDPMAFETLMILFIFCLILIHVYSALS